MKPNIFRGPVSIIVLTILISAALSNAAFASFSYDSSSSAATKPPAVAISAQESVKPDSGPAIQQIPARSSAVAPIADSPAAKQEDGSADSEETMEIPEESTKTTPIGDPLEPVNRVVFDANDFLDRLLLRPLAELDRALVPPGIRRSVVSVLRNMNEPVILANNLLQGEFDSAGVTAQRFAINTTLGVGGMFDWASDWDLGQQEGDFGQTLYKWGVGSGPYLVLPLFGPSNLRDAAGVGADTIISPWQYLAGIGGSNTYDTFEIVDFSVSGVTKREQNIEVIDALRGDSLDYYAKVRSVYTQYRTKQLGVEGMVVQPVIKP